MLFYYTLINLIKNDEGHNYQPKYNFYEKI
jgi:hypothetical protein